MKIAETGENLTILINSHTAEDWKAFASWYSIYKNLPNAKIILVCNRNHKIEFQYFQWAKRLKVPQLFQSAGEASITRLRALAGVLAKNLAAGPILCIDAAVMLTEPLDEFLLGLLNRDDYELAIGEDVWFSNRLTLKQVEEIWNNYGLVGGPGVKTLEEKLCFEAKESEDGSCLVSFKKGCGKWIDSKKGCPFSSAAGMVADVMTVNELRVIELWKKMVPLYSAVL